VDASGHPVRRRTGLIVGTGPAMAHVLELIAVAARTDVEPIMAAAKRAGIETWIIGDVNASPTGVRFAER